MKIYDENGNELALARAVYEYIRIAAEASGVPYEELYINVEAFTNEKNNAHVRPENTDYVIVDTYAYLSQHYCDDCYSRILQDLGLYSKVELVRPEPTTKDNTNTQDNE
jgi:hypothetical protein